MPYLWSKERTQQRLINNLSEVFDHVRSTYRLAEGDFPAIEDFKATLQRMDFYTFPLTDKRVLNKLQDILVNDIPRIIALISGMGQELEDDNEGNSDEFGSIDARAEKILKRSALRLYSDDDKKRWSVWVYFAIALIIAILAIILASHYDEHFTVRQIVIYFYEMVKTVRA